jgi:dihydroorotate dehydrogenase
MIKDINTELTELIKADGYANITEAIGSDRK